MENSWIGEGGQGLPAGTTPRALWNTLDPVIYDRVVSLVSKVYNKSTPNPTLLAKKYFIDQNQDFFLYTLPCGFNPIILTPDYVPHLMFVYIWVICSLISLLDVLELRR